MYTTLNISIAVVKYVLNYLQYSSGPVSAN